jgi:hypothetical protein
MNPRLSGIAIYAAAFFLGSLAGAAPSYQITVIADEADRAAQVATFALPADAPASPVLRDTDGTVFPLQVEAGGKASFVVPRQVAGHALVLMLVGSDRVPDKVTVSRARADLGVNVADRRTLVYQMDKEMLPRADIEAKFKRAAYLHPLISAAGAVVTGDYPSNHVHHHGIWTSWSRVQFQGRATNFWELAEEKGTTEFVGLNRTWNGPVHGGFAVRQQLVDFTSRKPTAALEETWEVTAYNPSVSTRFARVFDLSITQTCATADPVTLTKHLYGGLGYRGRDEWNGKENLIVLTSEGATTRDAANTTRVRWCYIGGAVESGAVAGVAILSHPENPRAPEPIRLHPDMPFLCFSPVQLGDLSIEPGKPYLARYRIVVLDGAPDRSTLDALWSGFARAPKVVVQSK